MTATSDFDANTEPTLAGGFLADVGLDSVEADPNHLPDATYLGYLTDCKIVHYKDAAKGKAVVFTYKVDEGDHKGKVIDEWKSANSFDDAQKKGWLKQRIISLGVPESRVGAVNPDDLIGTAVKFSVKAKGEYRNVTFVALRDETEADTVSALADL